MIGLQAKTQYGTVSAYNPNDYTIRAILQPEGVETGWIPLASQWAGNNLGAVFGPAIGDQVRIDFIGGEVEAALAGGRFFNVNAIPPIVQSGQGAIVDGAGSYVRLNNDGTITLGATNGITSTTPLLKQVGNLEVDGNVTVTQSVQVNASIVATQSISDMGGANGSIATLRTAYDNHVHPGVTAGTGNTGTTTSTV